MELNRERILELVALLRESEAAELAVEEGGVRIRVVRTLPGQAAPEATAPLAATAGLDNGVETVVVAVNGNGVVALPAAAEPEPVTVTSRVVGLFYRGSEPGGTPLVEVGQEVAEEQALGIVEVLRKPTEITSPVAGIVVEVVPEEGAGVQYGDPLFVIQP